jgi:hypothetical protein
LWRDNVVVICPGQVWGLFEEGFFIDRIVLSVGAQDFRDAYSVNKPLIEEFDLYNSERCFV